MFAAYTHDSTPQSDPQPDAVTTQASGPTRDWLAQSSYNLPAHALGRGGARTWSQSSSASSAGSASEDRTRSRSPAKKSRRSSEGRSRDDRDQRKTKKKKKGKKVRQEARECSPQARPQQRLSHEEWVAKFSTSKNFLDEVGLKPEHAFRQDWAGDRMLLKEARLPPNMAAYAKIRSRQALGDWAGQPRSQRNPPPRFFDKAFVRCFLGQTVQDLSQTSPETWTHASPNFIRIHYPSSDVKENSRLRDVYDAGTLAYSQGQSLPEAEPELDTDTIKLHEVQQKTKEFNEQLRQEPNDIRLWLNFVEFQNVSYENASFDEVSQPKKIKKKKASKNVILKQKALIEKKLAILKAAIDKNPQSIDLAVKRLDLSKEILDTATLDRQWQELIFIFPRNLDLWQHYLRFVATHFASFSLAKTLKAFRTCLHKLKTLQGHSFTAIVAQERPPDLEAHMLEILSQLTHFLAKAGFREKAIGLFQAMIELNLFSPDFPGYYSLEDRLALFEPFWDSGVARFGESGVVGWRKVMENKDKMAKPESHAQSSEIEDQILKEAGNRVARTRLWLELEKARERRHWCPWRSNEEDAEDPDRMVTFEDISPFLFQFTEPHMCFKLILTCLKFLGFHSEDHRLELITVNSQTMRDVLRFSKPECQSVDLDWSSILSPTNPGWQEDQSFESFCRNVFSQGSRILSEPYKTQLIVLWLGFEKQVFDHRLLTAPKKKPLVKELKSLVKSLLQSDQNNMDIYVAYAKLEHKLEGYANCWKILEMALVSHNQEPHHGLYTAAIASSLRELEVEESPEIRNRILWLGIQALEDRVYSQDRPNPIDLLQKAEETLIEKQNVVQGSLISENDPRMFIQSPVIDCVPEVFHKIFALGTLLNLYQGRDEAMKFLNFTQDKIMKAMMSSEGHKALLDLLLENVLKLKLDLSSGKQAKVILTLSLDHFPRNEYFLQKLCDLQVAPNGIDSTWRHFALSLSSSRSESTLPQIYAIKLLLKNYSQTRNVDEFSSSTAVAYLYRSKSLLEDQVEHDPGRTCPVLWRLLLWITKEIHVIQGRPGRNLDQISTVFYRALQECPVTRALYLDFIEYLHVDGACEVGELKKILDILSEKEGRVRLPWEELEILLEKEEDQDDVEDEEENVL
ncbi:hypothetical protein TCAL_06336 [Tigriopus californicus]|uniref:Protein NRDE2 homolog n=1 Tax=Tigriopus californicus TaxID=6832 RepID=A0A553P9P5_TIGCA|nr:nuclear exosome regulator NRDE2-like [Tigriopus californicus]TRY74407.1 hypothetical protein TCAL_06336 [Tigriopus californicus]|eukprot:TCALIF_06336-PA protein Name:"Similar to NRDE2 Protein NRDE2 homolog (Homo sapiens)" AED:0.11 eAED:0.11 QI:0/-1/0/1/-1/1/1/0/1136